MCKNIIFMIQQRYFITEEKLNPKKIERRKFFFSKIWFTLVTHISSRKMWHKFWKQRKSWFLTMNNIAYDIFLFKNVSVEKVAKTEYRWNYLHRKKNFKKSLTLVHASGCSFNVVRTSWAIFCWSPVPEYKVPTTVSKRPMSIFWLKSRSLLTVSWAKAVILELTFVKNFQWKNSRLHFPGAQSKLLCA